MSPTSVLNLNLRGMHLKDGTSRCLTCLSPVPATWVKRRGTNGTDTVHIIRSCETHGIQETLLSSDANFYWTFRGPQGCCEKTTPSTLASASGKNSCCLGGNATGSDDIGKLKSCVALIEIMHACNWDCPTCFAASPTLGEAHLKEYPLDTIKRNIEMNLEKKGTLDILMLSGGEPTLHPQFLELLEWSCSHKLIKYVLIVTNGSRFATDEKFVKDVAQIRRKYDNVMLYMQFDGPQLQGQIELRGSDRREIRQRAIDNCGRENVAITLVMALNSLTLPFVWDTVVFGLKYPHIRGVSFQPEFTGGRVSNFAHGRKSPLSVADVIHNLVEHSNGFFSLDKDFTSLPCGDPNCAIISYIFKMPDGSHEPLRKFFDISKIAEHLKTTIHYSIDDLKKCGCENPISDRLQEIQRDEHTFGITIKPFMGADTWDDDRIKRCCTHVITADGKMDSFCRHYNKQKK